MLPSLAGLLHREIEMATSALCLYHPRGEKVKENSVLLSQRKGHLGGC